jgi:hypothetical protein
MGTRRSGVTIVRVKSCPLVAMVRRPPEIEIIRRRMNSGNCPESLRAGIKTFLMIKRLTNLNKVVYEDPHRQFYHKNALDLAFNARTSPASELADSIKTLASAARPARAS